MQENNFEKQVQQKMDGLTLSPSGEVWKKLQIELEKKRDNKKGWFFLILIVICLAGGGSIWLSQLYTTIAKNDTVHNNVALNDSVAITNTVPYKKNENNKINTKAENKIVNHQNLIDTKLLVSNKTQPAIVSKSLLTKGFNASPISSTESFVLINKQQKFSRKAAAKTTMQVTDAELETISFEDLPKSLTKEFASFALLEMESRKRISPSIFIPKVLPKRFPFFKEKLIPQNLIANEKSRKSITGKNKNLSFLVSFGIGQTATSSNYLGATANRSYYDYASPLNANAGTGNLRSNMPSPVKPSIGIYVGFLAAKKIAQRSSLSIGLQYQFTSTSIGVGQAIIAADSSKAFATGNSNNYQNNYHFVQIPIEFLSQLSRFKQHNLFFNAGVSLSQLLHTNALQFNNNASQYFINNNYFNKTILGISAGISINLLKDNEAPLLLGPSLSYSLTPLAGKGLYDNSHYGFLGIRLLKVLKEK